MHHEIVGGQLSLGDGTKLPLSKATRAGDFLFLSGQLALGDDGQLKGTDISTQTERCIENIRAVLAEIDGDLTNVIKATVWLVERRDFGSFNKIYAKHTGKSIEEISQALERDNFMTADEAKKFGLIDSVVDKRK